MSSSTRPSVAKVQPIYIFMVCAILFGLGQFQRMSGAVIMPPIAHDLSIAVESLGLAAAALFFASAMAQIPIGMLLDRFGPRIIIPSTAVLAVIGSLLLASATNFNEVLLSRALIGLGYSATMMSTYVLFAKWFPPAKFATMASWLMASSSFGGIMASAPLAYSIELYGWRTPFVVVAGITLIMILLGILIVRDAPPSYQDSKEKPATMGQSIRGYMSVLKHPKFFNLLAMGFVAYGPAVALLGMWGGPYLEQVYGLSGAERGQILLLMTLAVPLAALFFGPLDRYFKSRKKIVFVAVFVELVAFATLGLVEDLALWAVTALFVLIAFVQQYYVVLAAQCRASFPDYLVGRANSTLNLISILGVAFLQSMFGWILAVSSGDGYAHSFTFVAGLLLVALFIYAFSSEKYHPSLATEKT
ncbi:MAG: MFS transporter [Proteobacteria bacterium]|nr:MFS transporter [Pseudomonadota bacterium]